MNVKKTGFTIVELLIVIVVIGILAAITIVAYNGFQIRAENAKTSSAVQAYRKGLLQYALEKGYYPSSGAVCLGADYPLLDGSTQGCRDSNSMILASNSAAPLAELKPYMGGSLPMPSSKILSNSAGTIKYVGAYFYGTAYNLTLDGQKVVAIEYQIEDTTCPVGPAYATTGWPAVSSPPVTASSSLNTSSRRCTTFLPDASRL